MADNLEFFCLFHKGLPPFHILFSDVFENASFPSKMFRLKCGPQACTLIFQIEDKDQKSKSTGKKRINFCAGFKAIGFKPGFFFDAFSANRIFDFAETLSFCLEF